MKTLSPYKKYMQEKVLQRFKTSYKPNWIPTEELYGSTVLIEGKQKIYLSSNDRLGLAAHPKVREAASKAAKRFGLGLNSYFLGGFMSIHKELEEKLAEFLGKEKVLVFNSGYLANIGSIPALAGRQDSIFIDAHSHASILDSCNLSKAEKFIFNHNDAENLKYNLNKYKRSNNKLIVVEGVYSVKGEICPLTDIYNVVKQYNSILFVDDAHGIGTLGNQGKGTLSYYNLMDRDDIILMGTFNKSLGAIGGFIAGDKDTLEYLKYFARSYMFTAAISPPMAAAVIEAINLIKNEPERIITCWDYAKKLHAGFKEMGYTVAEMQTPIISLEFKGGDTAFRLCQELYKNDIFTHAFSYPAVPKGMSLIRLVSSAAHTGEQIQYVLEKFYTNGKLLDLIE